MYQNHIINMKEVLYQFNPWWERKFETKTTNRDRYIQLISDNINTRDILFLVGMRRVGKTTIIYQFIEKLLKNIEASKILYISLDHPIFENKSLCDILTEFRKIHNITRDKKVFLFFDEIHMKKGFEKELKILYDIENVKIIASGSSSLVIRHKGAFLTGRYKKIQVYPLNFLEYLKFREIKVLKSEQYLLEKHLEDYMKIGGMPEYVIRQDPDYILELVDSVIYKDIVGMHGVKNPDILKKLFLLLIERTGKRLTYNKLSKILGLSSDTISQYISFFEETYLINIIHKHSKSLNERIYAPKKIYLSDLGIRNVYMGMRDIGSLAENLVFLSLKDLGEVFYYFESEKEIDFIVNNNAIEVKYKDDISDDELKALKTSKFKTKILISKKKRNIKGIENISFLDLMQIGLKV